MVHEHMLVDGPTGYLKHLLLHEDRRGLEHFFAKHNRYSTLEAREIFESPEAWPGLTRFFTDRVVRRRFLKSRVLPYVPLPWTCLLYTSDAADERSSVDLGGRRIIKKKKR